jgi:hypothetical protein
MNITSLIAPYHLQKLVEENYNHLDPNSQKFLLNMLVASDTNSKISTKQAIWLESLIDKMKKMNTVRSKIKPRRTRETHDDHETEVRAGSGPHAARLWCVKCNRHIQWITRDQNQLLTKI